MTEQQALCLLNAVPSFGNRRILKLIDFYGSACKALSLSTAQFERDKILPFQCRANLFEFDKDRFLECEYNLIKSNGIRLITCRDPEYPPLLKEIPDAPVVLYIKGNIDFHAMIPIAIVGSRLSSIYGMTTYQQLASQLAQGGMTVVSGMARGIDTQAHWAAIHAGGKTVAVAGCGLNQIYPPENRKLFDKIAQNGALVSEFPMKTLVTAYNFPRRNRIISGLSLGVVVVEASIKSGALITSDFALEQGREVFAVPGKVDNPQAGGVNKLIQQGAKLVTGVDDILQELQPCFLESTKIKNRMELNNIGIPQLPEDEQCIFENLGLKPQHMDRIIEKSRKGASKVMQALLKLEIKNLVQQLPGKLYKRIKG